MNLSSGDNPLDGVAVGESELDNEVEVAAAEVMLDIGVGEDDMSKVLIGDGSKIWIHIASIYSYETGAEPFRGWKPMTPWKYHVMVQSVRRPHHPLLDPLQTDGSSRCHSYQVMNR
jgi:hypothetical protein